MGSVERTSPTKQHRQQRHITNKKHSESSAVVAAHNNSLDDDDDITATTISTNLPENSSENSHNESKTRVTSKTSASSSTRTASSSSNKNANNGSCPNSDSSDDEAAVQLEGRQPFAFSRKISTKKGFDKRHCIKSGQLHIRRRTSFHQWKKRYFWLKGRVLFYARDEKAEIFEEINLTDARAAEERQKNVKHVFRILSSPRNFELKAESRKEMESWIQSIDHVSRQEFYDPNAQHMIISGQHTWYIMSHVKIVHCNVCRELLSPGGLPIVHGLSCAVCKAKAHKRCAVRAANNCKWSTLASVGQHVIEDADGTLDMEHQWVEGNLSHNSHCAVCDKKCGSFSKLVDERCLWCKAKVHTACKSLMPKRCSKSIAKYSVLSPVCIQSIDSSGLCAANNCRGGTTSPLLVFVNSKSGDNHGVKFLRKFKQLLNPAQVFDLMNGGPAPGLKLFQGLDQFRILICGGDGSISWVMSEMDKMNLHHKCQIGVLPLGTGNDLSRVLGWGSATDNDSELPNIINELEQSQIKMLDRWSIETFEWKQSFMLPTSEQAAAGQQTINEHTMSGDFNQENEDGSEKVTEEENANITMVDCLYKILYSTDYLTVLNYSRSLCVIVDKFLSRLLSCRELSFVDDGDRGDDSVFSEHFRNVQAKVKVLAESLNEAKLLTDEPETSEETESRTNAKEEEDKVFTPREMLMSRANSVKKAVLQIMEHTDNAINMTICPNMSSLINLDPAAHSTAEQPATPQPKGDPVDKPDDERKDSSASQPNVSFTLGTSESCITGLTVSTDQPPLPGYSLSSQAPGTLSTPRNISTVSLLGQSEGTTTTANASSHSPLQKQNKPCPRVRNALAQKAEEFSFVSKVLLANADAICAPVLPTFDDQFIQSQYEEKMAMNNYFGIGIDAKILYQFHTQRESHPEKFLSRVGNLLTFAHLGSREMITQTFRNFEKRIRLECDGQQIALPNLQGIVVLNIPSYSGGTDFWGSHHRGSSEPFTEPSFDDKIVEVMAVYSSAHIGVSRFINFHYHRIAQCRAVKLTILGTEPVPMQVDGEAWMQKPGFVKISHKNRAQMLVKDKEFRHAFRSWSLKPKEKLSTSSQQSEEQPGASSLYYRRVNDNHMECVVQATRHLIECLSSMNLSALKLSENVVTKCGEFTTLDEATQAGLQELTLCSTELCNEVQGLVDEFSTEVAGADSASMERLREALVQTQAEVDKCAPPPEHSPNPRRKRWGPFGILGRFIINRHKRGSSNSSKSSTSSAAESLISSWSTEEVGAWLASKGLGEYSPLFIRNDIRGSELLQLQRQDFQDLGITKVGHIKRIQSALKSVNLTKDS